VTNRSSKNKPNQTKDSRITEIEKERKVLQKVNKAAHAPHVDLHAIGLVPDDFGCNVVRGPAEG